jgi:DNA-binding IclR family transcriptional regulator
MMTDSTRKTTTDKALSLLSFFDDKHDWIGLTDLANAAGFDKASTLRHASALVRAGLLQQNPSHKKYALGSEVLRLARLREQHFPFQALVMPVLQDLTQTTGETSHASLLSPRGLATIASVESPNSTRVHIETGFVAPLHASASGLIYMAYSPEEQVRAWLAEPLAAWTDYTITDPDLVAQQVASARSSGIASSDRGVEIEVFSQAVAVFDKDRRPYATLAVVTPVSRAHAASRQLAAQALFSASLRLTQQVGGLTPADYQRLAEAALRQPRPSRPPKLASPPAQIAGFAPS